MPRQSLKLVTGGELTLTNWPGDDESAVLGIYAYSEAGTIDFTVAVSLDELADLERMIATARAQEAA